MGLCASKPQTHPEASAVFTARQKLPSSRSLSAAAAKAAAAPAARLDACELDDDTLGEVLSQLPLPHLVQLSGCSRRLFRLVHQSDKVLRAVDLRQLPTHKLDAALAFLARHPAADSIHTATLPSNLAGTAAALEALSGLQQLCLYRAAKAPFPEPDLPSLPLAQLALLASLSLELASGDVPAGQKLRLPAGLLSLAISAPTFGSAINPLELQQLGKLARLKLSVLDTANSKSLAKLLSLPGLQHLSLGRFWSLPDVLHGFSGLRSLEVFCYGKLPGPMGELETPLSAAACGLCSLPTRPNMHLTVHVSVLSECDGLAADWSSLVNLRSLSLDNIYPASSGSFHLGPLAELGRLQELQLGFESQTAAVAGRFTRLELQQLYHLVHLKDLAVTCSGPWVELVLEAPRHLNSLLVACQGRLLLAAPGTAAAAEAAAAAKRAAALGPQSSIVMRLSLDAPPTPTSPASGDSPASASPPASPSKAAAAAAAASSFFSGGASSAAKLVGGLGFGGGSGGHSTNSSLIGAAAAPHALHSMGSAGSGSSLGSPQGSWSAGSKDQFALLPELGGNDCSVLLMQRRLDRLGSIGESEEAYNQDDEAEQLSHISRLGLLTGRGIRMLDPSLSRCSTCSSIGGSSFSGTASATGRRRPGGSFTGKQADGAEGVMPLHSWLAAKGLDLATLQLVERRVSSSSSSVGAKGQQQQLPSLLARAHMEDSLLSTFRDWGFAA